MLLRNKIVVITGAAKGLGAAIAKKCAMAGATLVLADRLYNRVLSSKRKRSPGTQSMSVPCDVSNLADLRRLVDLAVARFGRIDGLVNNAGVNFAKPFLQVKERDFDHVIGVDLKGAFFLTQYCAQQMRKQRPQGGVVVQIASVHTIASLSGATPYDAAKHGLVGFSKAAAVELANKHVRVNILSPGLCRTEIWKDIQAAAPSKKACRDYWNSNIPGGRLIEPEEIADATVFLLSDLSRAITGANIVADLGMTSMLVSREPYRSRTIQ